MRCHHSLQQCPVLRQCACCGRTFITAGRRRRHQNACKAPLDLAALTEQQQHEKEAHRSPS